jgi:hypothetical protein
MKNFNSFTHKAERECLGIFWKLIWVFFEKIQKVKKNLIVNFQKERKF